MIGGRLCGSVGGQLVDATANGMLDHLQAGVVQFLDQAQGGRQQVGALW